jgi:hypothetical protein
VIFNELHNYVNTSFAFLISYNWWIYLSTFFGFVTIMWLFFAIFGFSYKQDWGLDYKTYSNAIIIRFTRLTFSMGDVTKATMVTHLVIFY